MARHAGAAIRPPHLTRLKDDLAVGSAPRRIRKMRTAMPVAAALQGNRVKNAAMRRGDLTMRQRRQGRPRSAGVERRARRRRVGRSSRPSWAQRRHGAGGSARAQGRPGSARPAGPPGPLSGASRRNRRGARRSPKSRGRKGEGRLRLRRDHDRRILQRRQRLLAHGGNDGRFVPRRPTR